MTEQAYHNGKIIAETQRLILREMVQEDLDALCCILCDPEVMQAAYETPFTRQEAQGWLERHRKRYETFGFGLWAVVLKDTGEMIGQCGLTWQEWRESRVLEIGYLFMKEHWHNGYATEAASACKTYAFDRLHAQWVYSIIRDSHTASRQVAARNGMKLLDTDAKRFRSVNMTFMLYGAQRL